MAELINWAEDCSGMLYLLTNGLALSESVVEELAQAKRLWVQVTLDGLTQEEVSSVQSMNVEHALRRLQLASQRLHHLCLNFTLYRHNLTSLPKLIDLAARLEVESLHISPVRVYDVCLPTMEGRRPDLLAEETTETFEKAQEQAKALGVDLRLPRATATDHWLHRCVRTGKFTPILRVDGTVIVCWGREDLVLGRLPEQSLEEILNSQWRKAASERLFSGAALPFCETCALRDPEDGILTPPVSLLQPVNTLPN